MPEPEEGVPRVCQGWIMHYTAGFSCFSATRKHSVVPKLLPEPLETREAVPQLSVCDGCSEVAAVRYRTPEAEKNGK